MKGLPLLKSWTVALVAIAMFGPAIMASEKDDSADGAWTFGAGVDARLRYEHVDDDAALDDANANTLRTRFSFTAKRKSFGAALIEFEDLRAIGSERYNSTANGRTNFATVADPESTELNRAWLRYDAPRSIAVKLGRQIVNRDRGRIIGDVGWRQNQQTFDALTAERGSGRYRFLAGYLARAKRIFGDDHPDPLLREFELDAWVGEGAMHFDRGTLIAILHYLEFENDPLRSHRNIGLRWSGKHKMKQGRRIEYRAEWIDQEPHSNGAPVNEAEYLAAEVGYEAERWGVGANLEHLGGDGVYGFQRPLATLHAYNGWADRFLGTPAEGLVDLFVDGRVEIRNFVLYGQYHRFDSDSGSLHYGDEFGLVVSRKFRERFDVMLKYASHNADDVGADVEKLWLSVRVGRQFDFR